MLETYYQLMTVADRIGNGASVDVQIQRYPPLEDTLVFRIDWPDNNHFMVRCSVSRFLGNPEAISDKVIAEAKHEYEKMVKAKNE